MRAIAAKLTDGEINGLAAYYRGGFRYSTRRLAWIDLKKQSLAAS
jgi:hypothetical protein